MRVHALSVSAASVCVLLLLSIVSAWGQRISLTGPVGSELVENSDCDVTWTSEGIRSVSIVLFGVRTPLGTRPRGSIRTVLAEGMPAEQGSFRFRMPWVDSIGFAIKLKGYDPVGKEVASSEQEYRFRPIVLASRFVDGIYLDLHLRKNQRLYVQKGKRLTHEYLCSSSQAYYWLPANRHITGPHDHAGVFHVLDKDPDHWSELFQVSMLWSLRYLSGHFIHATSRNLYRYLGRPASHGCNRLTHEDARALYEMTPVGARVEIIGPGG